MGIDSKLDPHTDELLHRGQLAMQALRYREEIARCKVQANLLQDAMDQAQRGDVGALENWLLRQDENEFEKPSSKALATLSYRQEALVDDKPICFAASQTTKRRMRVDPAQSRISPSRLFTWDRMIVGAEERLRSAPPTDTLEKTKANQPLEETLVSAIEGTCLEPKTKLRRQWWAATHVWLSLAVHLVFILCLSAYIVTVVQKPQIVSIVSGNSESEMVLMETPLESSDSLQSEENVSLPMPPLESLAKVTSDITIPSNGIEPQLLPTSRTGSLSSALESATNGILQAMSGSKMVSGAEFYGLKATGNTFVFVVDNSPSMRRDGAFDSAKREMIRSLSSMKPKQRFHISFFGKEIDSMANEQGDSERFPIYATPENLVRTVDWLNRVMVQREGWPPNDALAKAIQMHPDGVFLLFDGDTKVDVAKYLRKANRVDDSILGQVTRVPIHVVHFFNEEFQRPMKQVADENMGTYRFVPRPTKLNKGTR